MNHYLPQGLIVELNFQNLFKIFSSCNFGTGYGHKQIGFASYFNLKYTGSVSSVPLKTLRISVIILAIHYIVSLLNVDTGFT